MVEDDAEAFVLHRDHFTDMVRDCPGLTAAFVHHMLDRARDYRTVQLQDDRSQALGRLASGLAHELNNAASAATRNAQSLSRLLDEAHDASRALAAARLSDRQLDAVDAVFTMCTRPPQPRAALEAADREDDIAEWLGRHDIDPIVAEPLAACEVSLAVLEQLAGAVPAEALAVALRWAASTTAAREVAAQIVSATGRVHDLVGAVKGFTFMDREGVPEEIDVARGLVDTIAVLESKVRARSVDVRVADDGPGIPDETRARIFEPFFTTKPVGQGTGLGLDIVRRLVHRHLGNVDVVSQPGRTVLRVRLPVTGGTLKRNALPEDAH